MASFKKENTNMQLNEIFFIDFWDVELFYTFNEGKIFT